MAYYRGDYYRGDYYGSRGRGDFLSAASNLFQSGAAWLGNKLPTSWTPAGAQKVGLGVAGGALLGAGAMAAAPAVGRMVAGSALGKLVAGAGAMLPGAPPGTAWFPGRRRRSMNVGNVRALRRSLRRVSGFGRLASSMRRDVGKAATAIGVRHGRSAAWPARKK